jgi:hypothetical protein
MNKRLNNIQFIGLLLILVACWVHLPLPSGIRKQLPLNRLPPQVKAGKQAEDAEKKVIVQPVSFEAVVNLVQFNLTQDFYILFGPTFSKLQLFTVYTFQRPSFVISYFKNTFCHHIAINAP